MIQQLDLFRCLPGVAGGRTLRARRDRSYFQQLGRRGGQQTLQRYGRAHFRALARRSRDLQRLRRYTQPTTVIFTLHGERWAERIIPYWPQKSTRRRKRPIFVRIELWREEVGS